MHRVLVLPQDIQPTAITIHDPQTLHYLLHVLRVKVGDPLECFDGRGQRYAGMIIHQTRRELTVRIDQHLKEPTSRLQITLAQALIKPERFEWAIQKATELGVARIVPLMTSRTTIRLKSSKGHPRLTRWQRIIEAAASQCGRATLPALDEPQSFARAIENTRGCGALLPTLVGDAKPIADYLSQRQNLKDMTVFIGPEGDFTPEEVDLAIRAGVQPVRLGPVTLRSETAALVMLTILQHSVGAL